MATKLICDRCVWEYNGGYSEAWENLKNQAESEGDNGD